MVTIIGDKLPAPALQQGILISTATQTLIVEDRTWAEVGMLQGCPNLTGWTADRDSQVSYYTHTRPMSHDQRNRSYSVYSY